MMLFRRRDYATNRPITLCQTHHWAVSHRSSTHLWVHLFCLLAHPLLISTRTHSVEITVQKVEESCSLLTQYNWTIQNVAAWDPQEKAPTLIMLPPIKIPPFPCAKVLLEKGSTVLLTPKTPRHARKSAEVHPAIEGILFVVRKRLVQARTGDSWLKTRNLIPHQMETNLWARHYSAPSHLQGRTSSM